MGTASADVRKTVSSRSIRARQTRPGITIDRTHQTRSDPFPATEARLQAVTERQESRGADPEARLATR